MTADGDMTVDTDPSADDHRDPIGFLREKADELGITASRSAVLRERDAAKGWAQFAPFGGRTPSHDFLGGYHHGVLPFDVTEQGENRSVKMSPVTKTPVTNFRIPADIKAAAQAKAEAEGKTLSRVVVDLLREYARPV